MYTEFFNLKTKPFELLPNPEFLYPSAGHRKVLNYLTYGISEKTGFILFTGEVGCGKTTTIRNIIRDLGRNSVVSLVFNSRVNGEQLIGLINEDFGLDVRGKGKVELLRDLNDFLLAKAHEKIMPILIIDEAQNLSSEALEEVRMLSNLEAETFKFLQIILVGQPELKTIIAHPSLSQLRQRIGISCHLEALNRQETEDYVLFRLEKAGNRDAIQWCEGSFDALFTFSKGVPRLINLFCDFLFLAAFVDDTRMLTMDMIRDVVGDIGWDEPPVCVQDMPIVGGTPVDDLDLVRQLRLIERKLDQIKGADGFSGVDRRLTAQESILVRLVEKQESEFRNIAQVLRLVAEDIFMLKKMIGKKESESPKSSVSVAAPVRKGVLSRFFG